MSDLAVVGETAIEQAFDRWAAAIGSGDAERVASLYAPDAVLVPTFASDIRWNAAEIADYFRGFVQGGPLCRRLEGTVRAMGEVAVHSGIYRFTMTARDGRPELDVRFTFVHQRIGGEWLIVTHHSSVGG